jgi:hypothetical protein
MGKSTERRGVEPVVKINSRRLTEDLHSATSQKTIFVILTAVKTSNLTTII